MKGRMMNAPKKRPSSEPIEISPIPLSLLRTGALLTGLIGFFALMALLAQDVLADDFEDEEGFDRGRRSLSNPFADTADYDEEMDFFPEDDEPEERPSRRVVRPERSRPTPPSRPAPARPRGGGSAGAQRDVPDPVFTATGVQVGGGQPHGLAARANEIDSSNPYSVDPISGSGSEDIVITDFNFPDADILDVAKTLGKLTGKNFIFDNDVRGRITIISNAPISVSDAWRAFLTALDINQFTLIPAGQYIRIARQRDARDKNLRIYDGDTSPDVDQLITRIFKLRHIDADEVARTFRNFTTPNARVISFEQTNTLIVTDTGSNIEKLAQIIAMLDIEGFDAGISVIRVNNASAADLADLIDQLLPGTSAPPRNPRARGSAQRGRGGNFSARRTSEGGVINTIIADERTNTLIVHANGRGVSQVKELVDKLDQEVPPSLGSGRIHVVYLQFAEAEVIAQTLNNLSQAGGAQQRRGAPRGARGAGTGSNPNAGELFEGGIRVSPDMAVNALVITASPSDFQTLQQVIHRLDIPRDQVYVEAVIMEMTMGRGFEYSSNVVLPTQTPIGLSPGQDLVSYFQNPYAAIAGAGLTLGLGAGGSKNIEIAGQTVEVRDVTSLVKALQTHANANVLATPQILTLDNVEAMFETAENIPVPSTAISDGLAVTSIDRQKVSLAIKIKPQINKASDFVKLDVEAKLEDISQRNVPSAVAQQAVATFERNTKTSVVVADKDTVVLGGLVRDKTNETVSKVPILGDIPVLGWLFRAKKSQVEKTNLFMLLTPRIIRQYEEMREILDDKLLERDGFLEKNMGGRDPYRDFRDEMIRKLPDLDDLLEGRNPSKMDDAEAYNRRPQSTPQSKENRDEKKESSRQ
jgi:general secretion pathway protein D